MESSSWKASQRFQNVGQLKKSLKSLPDEMKIRTSNSFRERGGVIRYEEDENGKWITFVMNS